MTNIFDRALIASLGAMALLLGASNTFAGSPTGQRGLLASTHSISHSPARSFRHHRRNHGAIVWPGDVFGPLNGEPLVDLTQPIPGDIRNTQAADIPWDWAHRYPPIVAPSERPYVPSCLAQTVTVPSGHGSAEQAVNITRCY